ncbi:50S ribosomal protein L18e [Candidatus Woesearchaeota archaeon]|nr:50S ribosomal protein L18e [Candidatus Woesearchaeota archaeon]
MTKTNKEVLQMITNLKNMESKLISRVADEISRTGKKGREVNLTRLNRFTKENETIIVPGKVLGGGDIDHKITISALKFSRGALSKLEKSGSKIVPLYELMKEPVQGKKIRIIG